MAVIFKCKSIKIYLFYVYLPCFEYSDEYSIELRECVAFIELIIDQQKVITLIISTVIKYLKT